MGKHTKLKAKPSKGNASQPSDIDVHDRLDALLAAELDSLQSMRTAIDEAIAEGDLNPALVRESNGIARAMVAVSAEIRQLEKHSRDAAERMTSEEKDRVVLGYLRNLPRDRFVAVRDAINELDEPPESILGL